MMGFRGSLDVKTTVKGFENNGVISMRFGFCRLEIFSWNK